MPCKDRKELLMECLQLESRHYQSARNCKNLIRFIGYSLLCWINLNATATENGLRGQRTWTLGQKRRFADPDFASCHQNVKAQLSISFYESMDAWLQKVKIPSPNATDVQEPNSHTCYKAGGWYTFATQSNQWVNDMPHHFHRFSLRKSCIKWAFHAGARDGPGDGSRRCCRGCLGNE